ncbi:MAG: peptide ABC transporter substrate-binding protein [Anaerolineales bacterium]|nr:peptide ABC transporter substrate-binding protein [Anaerolineales bacterium]
MIARRYIRPLFYLVILASLVLSSCAQVAATPTKTPKVAKFIFTQEFDSLNPLYTNMWFSAITHQIWNCWAWDFDEVNNPRPILVKEIPSVANGGISADGKTITMKLRDDIVWSDGEKITSADFAFTYNMTVDPKNAVASTSPYDKIVSFETPDEQTVVMTFDEAYAPWVGTLWHGILPEHVLKPVFDKDGTIDNAEWNRAPTVGCGPFVFKEWESGSFSRFLANDKYWLGRPKLDEIFIRFVPDDASQIAALKAGDGDLGTFFPFSDVPDLEKAGITVIKSFSGYNEVWYLNVHPDKAHPALLDVRVRQALAYGFDRATLVNDLLLGKTAPAATMWDNSPYVDPSLKPYPYDPEKAKALLDEAGWKDSNNDGVRDKDGVELVLRYGTTTREIRQDTQAVAQQQLAAIGVKIELTNYDSDIFFAGYGENGPAARGEMDIFEYSTVTQFPDPDSSDFLCSEIPSDESPAGVNWTGLCDEELDQLFQLQATQVDFSERQQTFWKISKLIYDNVYTLGLWQDPDLFGISARLLNVKISGATPFFNVIEWDMTQ